MRVPPPGKDGWEVDPGGVPKGSTRSKGRVPTAANAAIAYSEARRLIDPFTGKAVSDPPTVVVLAARGATAAPLAAAAALLGKDRGAAVVRSAGAAGRILPPASARAQARAPRAGRAR